jgi:dolichol-phosphate mannosyltransferase
MPARRIACIVLPTFNEAGNIKALIPSILAQSSVIKTHDLHVLVVDDNSPDGTALIVEELMRESPRIHLLRGEKKGLGDAYQRGMAHALARLDPDLIVEMDADFQHDPGLLPRLIALNNDGFSLVIGSRFLPGGATPSFPWHRRWISLAGTVLVRAFGGLQRFTDCTSGYRCIRAELIRKCDLTGLSTRGYSFQSSLLCELIWNGARPIELPIIFNERRQGSSKLSLRDQVEFVINLLQLLLKRLWRKLLRPRRTSVASGIDSLPPGRDQLL